MVQGGMTCVKYLVFGFNLLFFIFGIVLIGVGAYVQIQLKQFTDFFTDTNISGPAILLIVLGVIVFIVAFFGCCGAIKENYCMVLTFSILLILILICEIGGGIAGFVLKGDIAEIASKELLNSIQRCKENADLKESWEEIQIALGCCGVNGEKDWHGISSPAPPPCQSNSTGCLDKIEATMQKNVYSVGAAAIALAIIEVSGVVLAICLAKAIRREYDIV